MHKIPFLIESDLAILSLQNQTKTQTLHLLQIYRGLAAISVVCFHASTTLITERGFYGIGRFFLWGFSGVPLFFVLSGFIICFIHFSDIGIHQRAGRYLYKRFVRIYPLYWLMLLFYLPAFLYPIKILNWSIIFENFTLLRTTHFDTIILVAWTLSHEILFYFIFLVLIIHRMSGMVLISIWSFLILHCYSTGNIWMPPYALTSLTGIDYGVFTNFMRLVSAPINVLFALGALSCLAFRLIRSHQKVEFIAKGALLIGIFIFIVASGYWLGEGKYENGGSYNYAFGIAAFFLLVASGSLGVGAWAANQHILLMLGDASYSIYLIHYGLQTLLVSVLEPSTIINMNFYFIVLIVVPIFFGILSYRYVESPLMSIFGRVRRQVVR